jgi:hypothetical protein
LRGNHTDFANHLTDLVASRQQVWSPAFAPADTFGAVASDNLDLDSTAPLDQAVELFLAAYLATGNAETLERAAAATGELARRVAAAPGLQATAAAWLQWSLLRTGDAWIDVAGGFGVCFAPGRVRDVSAKAGRLQFELDAPGATTGPFLTHLHGLDPARNWQLVIHGNEQQPLLAPTPHQVLAVVPQPLLHATFQPPTEVAATMPLWFQAAITESPAADLQCWVEYGSPTSSTTHLQLQRDPVTGRFRHRYPQQLVAGTELWCRLQVRAGTQRLTLPPLDQPPHRIQIGGALRADCGDDEEPWLVDAGGSRRVRFGDGREWARALSPEQALIYDLPHGCARRTRAGAAVVQDHHGQGLRDQGRHVCQR